MSLAERIEALGNLIPILELYINNNSELKDGDDSFNLEGFTELYIGSNFGWDFLNISKPTIEELEALKEQAHNVWNSREESIQASEYLKQTDWYIIRELDTGVPCPTEIRAARQSARAKII